MKRLMMTLIFACLAGQTFSASKTIEEKKLLPEKLPFRIPRVNESITVDAVLDEAIWKNALRVDANIEVRPGENIPAPVQTEALLAFTDSHILAGFICYDPDPSQIRARLCDRDNVWDDDWILILFDTFNDQRRTYDFFCNPLGIQGDMVETTTGGGPAWDAIWESSGRITDEGYMVEMAIPFRAIGFQRSDTDQIWGFDVVRSYPRSVRHYIGAFPRDRNNNCYMCQSLKMVGFEGATPGRNIELDPTVSAVLSQERKDWTSGPFQNREKKADPGLSASWGFTPNLTASAAVNPDFSNIEADIIQLDINNQFAIYYPEKRPFFLQGNDFFNTPFNLVHTRTLANPDWGVKVAGKEGQHGIGFFSVQDHMTNFIFPGAEGSDSHSLDRGSMGSVLRYKRDVGKSSNLGVVFTDREGDQYHNRVAGVDGDIKFTQKDRIMFQISRSMTRYPGEVVEDYSQPGSEFGGNAVNVFYAHDTRSWEVYTLYRQVDHDFRADLGFMTQSGFTYTETGGSYTLQRDSGWYNNINFYMSHDYKRDRFNNPLHRAMTARINYNGPMQSYLGAYTEMGKDMYNGERYRANWINFFGGFKPTSWIRGEMYSRMGDRIDYANCRPGRCWSLNPNVMLWLGMHLTAEIGHTYERLDVDPGRLYDANISRLKLMYQFDKRLFLRTIFQYKYYKRDVALYTDEVDPVTKGLFSQVLLSYKVNPQTVFFLGYSDDYYGDHMTGMVQTNRTLFAKIGYAYIM